MRIKNEKEWFSEQIIKMQDSMYGYAYCILKNDSDVQDVMQEAMIKAYENLDMLKNPKSFQSWIMTILRNCSYDLLRGRKEFLELNDELTLVDSSGEFSEECDNLYEAVQSLAIPYRTVVYLYYYEDMSVRDISHALGIDSATVRKRLSRARGKLMNMLRERGE